MKELSIYQRRTKPLVQEKDQSANKKNNNSYNTTINYPLLDLNAVIIGSIFYFLCSCVIHNSAKSGRCFFDCQLYTSTG